MTRDPLPTSLTPRHTRRVNLPVLLFTTACAAAQDPPHTVEWESVLYDDGSGSSALSYSYTNVAMQRFDARIGVGKLTLDPEPAQIREFQLGWQSPRFGVMGAFWGDSDILTTREGILNIQITSSDWDFRVSPAWRRIDLYGAPLRTADQQTTRPHISIDSPSMTLAADYLGYSDWVHGIEFSAYHYSRDMTRLNADAFFDNLERLRQSGRDLTEQQILRILRIIELFSRFANALALSSSFVDWSARYDVNYFWRDFLLTASADLAQSAVTQTRFSYIGLEATYIAPTWAASAHWSFDPQTPTNWLLQTRWTLFF